MSKKVSYDQKSGVDFKELPKLHGGMPPKKSLEQIDSANTPKKAPKSVK
jgi:hypothetical protein